MLTMWSSYCVFTVVFIFFPNHVFTSRDCGSATADIVFILDSSGSVGKSNFMRTKDFFKTMVDGFNIGSNKVRMGSVTYSTMVHDTFQLNEYTSKDILKARIGSIPYDSGGTNTHRALKYALEESFRKYGRHDVAKIVIVITDGRSNSKSSTLKEAEKLRNSGVIVFSVGVGDGVDGSELQGMASKSTYVFNVTSFNALRNIRERLTKTTCEAIDCGKPGTPHHGTYHGSDFSRGKSITYTCHPGYRLSGTNTSTCQKDATWSESLPHCIFVESCRSNPCKNNGTCENGDDSYKCNCSSGYIGINCETDSQPPVVEHCPDSIRKTSSERFVTITWKAPDFYDPHNYSADISVTSNYPEHGSTFFWGDYTVWFSALKLVNGLRTNCTFNVTVRPYPCKDLKTPLNGSVVCNGWVKEFTRVCVVFCRQGTILSNGHDFRIKYVCGGSGNWIPTENLPACIDRGTKGVSSDDDDEKIRYFFKNCSSVHKDEMREHYVKILRNATGFRSLCDNYTDLCKPENVDVQC